MDHSKGIQAVQYAGIPPVQPQVAGPVPTMMAHGLPNQAPVGIQRAPLASSLKPPAPASRSPSGNRPTTPTESAVPTPQGPPATAEKLVGTTALATAKSSETPVPAQLSSEKDGAPKKAEEAASVSHPTPPPLLHAGVQNEKLIGKEDKRASVNKPETATNEVSANPKGASTSTPELKLPTALRASSPPMDAAAGVSSVQQPSAPSSLQQPTSPSRMNANESAAMKKMVKTTSSPPAGPANSPSKAGCAVVSCQSVNPVTAQAQTLSLSTALSGNARPAVKASPTSSVKTHAPPPPPTSPLKGSPGNAASKQQPLVPLASPKTKLSPKEKEKETIDAESKATAPRAASPAAAVRATSPAVVVVPAPAPASAQAPAPAPVQARSKQMPEEERQLSPADEEILSTATKADAPAPKKGGRKPTAAPKEKGAKPSRAAAPCRGRSQQQGQAKPTPPKAEKTPRGRPNAAAPKTKAPLSESGVAAVSATTSGHSDQDAGVARPKRQRVATKIFQSPVPDDDIPKSLLKSITSKPQPEHKVTLFSKGEFLAVRNGEGSFYVCQALQNIHSLSHKISIRWLSKPKDDSDVYSPDFHDKTDREAILCDLDMVRLDKGRFRLPAEERTRAENILNRSIEFERSGGVKPRLTAEHPDGIDISMVSDESQLKAAKPRKISSPAASASSSSAAAKTPKRALKAAQKRKSAAPPAASAVKGSKKRRPMVESSSEEEDVEEEDGGSSSSSSSQSESGSGSGSGSESESSDEYSPVAKRGRGQGKSRGAPPAAAAAAVAPSKQQMKSPKTPAPRKPVLAAKTAQKTLAAKKKEEPVPAKRKEEPGTAKKTPAAVSTPVTKKAGRRGGAAAAPAPSLATKSVTGKKAPPTASVAGTKRGRPSAAASVAPAPVPAAAAKDKRKEKEKERDEEDQPSPPPAKKGRQHEPVHKEEKKLAETDKVQVAAKGRGRGAAKGAQAQAAADEREREETLKSEKEAESEPNRDRGPSTNDEDKGKAPTEPASSSMEPAAEDKKGPPKKKEKEGDAAGMGSGSSQSEPEGDQTVAAVGVSVSTVKSSKAPAAANGSKKKGSK